MTPSARSGFFFLFNMKDKKESIFLTFVTSDYLFPLRDGGFVPCKGSEQQLINVFRITDPSLGHFRLEIVNLDLLKMVQK